MRPFTVVEVERILTEPKLILLNHTHVTHRTDYCPYRHTQKVQYVGQSHVIVVCQLKYF